MRRAIRVSFLLILMAFVERIRCVDPADKVHAQATPAPTRQNNNEDPALNPTMTWEELVKMSKKINQQQELDEEYERVMKQAEAEFNANQGKNKREPTSNIRQKEVKANEDLVKQVVKKNEPIANIPQQVQEKQKTPVLLQQPKRQMPTSKLNNAVFSNAQLPKKEPEKQQTIVPPVSTPPPNINNQFKKAEQQRKNDMEIAAKLKAIKQRELELEKIKKRNEVLLREAEMREDSLRQKTEQARQQKIIQLEAQKAKLVEEQKQHEAYERARLAQKAASLKMAQQNIKKENQRSIKQAEIAKEEQKKLMQEQQRKLAEQQRQDNMRRQKEEEERMRENKKKQEKQEQLNKLRLQSQRRQDMKAQQQQAITQAQIQQHTQMQKVPVQQTEQLHQMQQVQQRQQQARQVQLAQHTQTTQQQTSQINQAAKLNNPTINPALNQATKAIVETPTRKLSPEERRRAEQQRKRRQEQIYGQLEEEYEARRAKFMQKQKQKKLLQMKKQREEQERIMKQKELAMTKEQKQQLQRKQEDQARLERLLREQREMALLIQKTKTERAQKEKEMKLKNMPIPPEKPFWDQKEPPVHPLDNQAPSNEADEAVKDQNLNKQSEEQDNKWQQPEDATEDYNLKTILDKKKGKVLKPDKVQKKITVSRNHEQQSTDMSGKGKQKPKTQIIEKPNEKIEIAKSILEYAEQIDLKETRRKIILEDTQKVDDSQNISFTKSELFFLTFSLILGIAMFLLIKRPPGIHQNFDGPNFQGGMLISTQELQ